MSVIQGLINYFTCLFPDSPPAKYWEALAEKRKEALEETLTENKELHEKNKKLESEVAELKEENKLLEEMVDEAKQLATLVQVRQSIVMVGVKRFASAR